MKIAMTYLLAYALVGPVHAATWVSLGATVSGDEYEVDYDSIVPEGTSRKGWVRVTYTEPITGHGGTVAKRSAMLMVAKCREGSFATRQYVHYGLDAKVVSSDVIERPQWMEPVPESMNELVVKPLCASKPARKK